MPPYLPRKRLRSSSPEPGPSTKNSKKSKGKAAVTPRKPNLFDDLDAGIKPKVTPEQSKALLEKLNATDEEESSLSSLSEAEFEDVPLPKKQRTAQISEDEDEDMEFEDVDTTGIPVPSGPEPSGDLELTLIKDHRVSLTNPLGTKKGPSKIERGIRIHTHQMHVMSLMWANSARNSWLCDKELQHILVGHLSKPVNKEVDRWRRDSGLLQKLPRTAKAMGKSAKGKKGDIRSQRDWGSPAERLESGQVNKSRPDPLYKLLERLMTYWRQRFRITAPGSRKIGYFTLEMLDAEMKSLGSDAKTGTFDWKLHDPELHGERIKDIEDLRQHAKSLEGSRDVASQLFTALLRGLGVESRMVASLQPLGFGWGQFEEASEKNPRKLKMKKQTVESDDDSSEDEGEEIEEAKPAPKSIGKGKGKARPKPNSQSKSRKRMSTSKGDKEAPIELSDQEDEDDEERSSDESIIDITPAKQRTLPSLPYDTDLLFPHYWTEVLSPVTNTYVPVDPVVLHVMATDDKKLEKFETRGGKAEKAKQVTAYIVGYSADGTAKDVTTRYLKRHIWPGRTKGNRLPVEKIPIRNHNGKIKSYEEFDWFKTVMSLYARGTKDCPLTEIDDHEEATDLKPAKTEKKVVEEGKETLQSYKTSTEFVLERHFKREEALAPGAKHIKMFTIKGKGEDSVEEKVYLRKDVVKCKSMETWHKEGRAPIIGQEPLKRVPYRVATTNRRRELAEAEHATGEKVLQGLFSEAQTDWIIPPPIENGVIPKNGFGNIDLYVDSMLPEGAAHIPRRGTAKICKRLGIDFAEAVTGFEFGHRMAVPVITGVVIAEEHEEAVMEEWVKDEAERVRKEDEKRTKTALTMWRKMLMGMRIVERVREDYGDNMDDSKDAANPFTNKKNIEMEEEAQARLMVQRDEDMAGGFLPEGHDEEERIAQPAGFFPVFEEGDNDNGGGFVIEGHDEEPAKPTSNQKFEFAKASSVNSEVEHKPDLGEDEETKDLESKVITPAPKKRGRPSGSVNKVAKSQPTPKPKAAAKRSPKPRTAVSNNKANGKRKAEIEESEQDDDEDSPWSEPESEPEVMVKKMSGRRATIAAKPESARKVPARKAARRSEGKLRSRYFEHDSDEDDDA